jgi:hypothetical protein
MAYSHHRVLALARLRPSFPILKSNPIATGHRIPRKQRRNFQLVVSGRTATLLGIALPRQLVLAIKALLALRARKFNVRTIAHRTVPA